MKKNNRKLGVSIVTIIVVLLGMVIFSFKNGVSQKKNPFQIPADAKYALAFTTSKVKSEKSYIDYLDETGTVITRNKLNSVLNEDSINCYPETNKISLFTHEKIYQNNSEEILQNEEMQKLYKFASSNGYDYVYNTGYLEKYSMFYKLITHGLAYDMAEYGAFDLLTFYNDKKVYNVRVSQCADLAVNQDTGSIYLIIGNEGSMLSVEKVDYQQETKQFQVNKFDLDISAFFEKAELKNESYALGKAMIHEHKLYVFIQVGEEKAEDYLMEFELGINEEHITYTTAYDIDLKEGEIMSDAVYATVKGDEIKYYPLAYPKQIITFDCSRKEFTYEPFPEIETDSFEPIKIREIDEKIYVLHVDYDNQEFEIDILEEDNSMKKVVRAKVSKFNNPFGMWFADFYVFDT